MSLQRLLLCRPAGGLNDMLCQIERACLYAERFDRTVIVETDHQSATEFRDSFANYFMSLQDRLLLSAARFRRRFDALAVFPEFLQGRVTAYQARNAGRAGRMVDAETGLRLSFDFDRDYNHTLLVHHDFGGGRLSLGALARMRLQPALAAGLARRALAIGGPYAALHIRSTDYRARYRDQLPALAGEIPGPVFVATDSREALDHCRNAFGPARVVSFADLRDAGGAPLHHLASSAQAWRRNTDAILDLLTLARAERLCVFELESNPVGAKVSGFTTLALDLRSAPEILDRLAPAGLERRSQWSGGLRSLARLIRRRVGR